MPTASPTPSTPRPKRRNGREARPAVQWQREVPETIRALDTLAAPDYADIVTAPLGEPLSTAPEQLVFTTLHALPRILVRVLPLVQRLALGLRLELRPSPDHLLGWRIVERHESWLRIEASSWLLTGHVVLHADDDRLSFASFVRYERPLAALIWRPVSLIHRQVALTLVRNAVKIAEEARPPNG